MRKKFLRALDGAHLRSSHLAMASTPTRPGLELARMLRDAREAAGWNKSQAADYIGKTVATYRKWESGTEPPRKGDLRALLQAWGISSEEIDVMVELCEQARQSDWTSKYGPTEVLRKLLGFEGLVKAIKAYEPAFIYGPIQTEDYARAVMRGAAIGLSDEEIERAVVLRMERQQRNFAQEPPDLELILDESAIRKVVGGPKVMAGQLRHLTTLVNRCEIRILPSETDAHPGMTGAFYVLEFPSDVGSPTVYSDSRRSLFLSDTPTVTRAMVDFKHLWECSLTGEDSRKKILGRIEELEK